MYYKILNEHKEEIQKLATMKERLLFVADFISEHNMDDNTKWNRIGASSTPDMLIPFSKITEHKLVEKTLRDKADAEDYSLLDITENGYTTICNDIIKYCYEVGNLKVV